MAYLNVVTKWKKYVFTLGHGSSNQIIIFSLDHDVVKVEMKKKKKFSWSWHGEGSRRRGCSRKIKVVKIKIIFFCQNHAVVNAVVVTK